MSFARLLAAAVLLAALPAAGPAGELDTIVALDATARTSPLPPQQQPAYASAKDALRAGVHEYNAGNKTGAARALEYAADQGNPLALWKLGHMYADGDGVPRNDLKAFECFSRIADENAEEAPESPRAGVVANAFVALGGYFLDGIKGSYVVANPERAAEMYSYAASYFGDPGAQYNLARLYLDGNGVERDARQAARWLNLAAEKGLSSAQALLGQLLVNGDGVPQQRARGLMWLEVARQNADAKQVPWISSLHAEAFDGASETEKRTALGMTEQFQAKKR